MPSFRFDFIGQTNFEIVYRAGEERFRPEDFSGLTENRSFYKIRPGIFFETGYFKQVTIEGDYRWGTEINFSPAAGGEPILADQTKASLEATVRPISPLKIENTYILFQLRDRSTGANIFSNHIVRSNWNWQFNRELSLRFILQYDALLRNPALTDLTPRRNVNADFLITYLINPGTALFVGYNTNAQNFDLAPNPAGGRDIVQTGNRFINDARQFFVKFSYLYRF